MLICVAVLKSVFDCCVDPDGAYSSTAVARYCGDWTSESATAPATTTMVVAMIRRRSARRTLR